MTHTISLKPTRPGNSRLVITRRHGESVQIGESTVTVRMVRGDARLTIESPRDTKIMRTELLSDGELLTDAP